MKIEVTPHAVERFIKRHAPELSFDEAKAQLVDLAETASPTKAKTHAGDEVWATTDRIRLVMKRDVGNVVVCVTVLPEGNYEMNHVAEPEQDPWD